MADKLIEMLESQVRVPLWLFIIIVAGGYGYDVVSGFGLIS